MVNTSSEDFGLNLPQHRRLLHALDILHAHNTGEFSERLFLASLTLFEDSAMLFGMRDRKSETLDLKSNLEISPSESTAMYERMNELGPMEHPIFPLLKGGTQNPMRVSDHLSDRLWRRTTLYQEVLKRFGIERQLILPLYSPAAFGGLGICRSGKDYGAKEIALAHPFARQVALAHETSLLLKQMQLQLPLVQKLDLAPFSRLGLTPRETEILHWVAQGKRDREIAIILGISARTVHSHVARTYAKLGIENRSGATSFYYKLTEMEGGDDAAQDASTA